MEPPKDTEKDRILLQALPHAVFDGWTRELLAQAAKEAGIEPARTRALFPQGVAGLVHHFSDWADRQMLDAMAQCDLDALRVRDRVTLGVRARLEALAPHKEALRKSLGFLARPPHCFTAPKLVWQTADRIWWQAGDTATDYNHYTKRGLLSGVLGKTTLFFLNDASEGHEKTWEFLDRQIETVLKIGRKISQLKRN